jgi:uncharacterized membrane protein
MSHRESGHADWLKGRMIGYLVVEIEPAEPSVGEMQPDVLAKPPLGPDAVAVAYAFLVERFQRLLALAHVAAGRGGLTPVREDVLEDARGKSVARALRASSRTAREILSFSAAIRRHRSAAIQRSAYQNIVLLCSTCLNSVKDVSARRIGCRVAELDGYSSNSLSSAACLEIY